ncbi:hypothetical protein GQX74_010646 [Glossina fuscipes]|nr:hypothetical protein GQX74_010646 [Glossina fuscipes]
MGRGLKREKGGSLAGVSAGSGRGQDTSSDADMSSDSEVVVLGELAQNSKKRGASRVSESGDEAKKARGVIVLPRSICVNKNFKPHVIASELSSALSTRKLSNALRNSGTACRHCKVALR